MSILEAKKKWGVAPAFNIEFVAYYQDREKRIADLKQQVSQDKREFEQLRQEDSETTLKYDAINKILAEKSELNSTKRNQIEDFRKLLSLGGHNNLVPDAVPPVVLSKSTSSAIASANIRARSTAYSSQGASQVSQKISFKIFCNQLIFPPFKVSKHLKTCGVCGKSHDQHLLAHCDTCHLHYHLGCLTPPMTRMPKKSKLYGWSCSECYPDSSGDEQVHVDLEDLSSDANIRKRRENRRQAASKALIIASSADNSGCEDEELKKALETSAKLQNGLENKQREDLIAKAAEKAERKRKRKEEKARRKAERKAEKKRILESNAISNGASTSQNDNSDVEIIEEENGICTVSIQPKPIKLTIKTNGHHNTSPTETPTPAVKKPPKGAPKDVRTQCDKCLESGDNASLVRCDECKRCYHFGCLIPPMKKSPKVTGYGWHCNDCDPSDRDSDWHLD